MKPLIGITTGEIENAAEPWESSVHGQKRAYSNAIIDAGGIPLFIPWMPEDRLKDLYSRLDGILFAGGNDIKPSMYGEEAGEYTVDVTPERDEIESLLMSWALTDDKPLFAICRGYQLFNVLLGGTLYQDINSQLENINDHEMTLHAKDYTLVAHRLKVDPASQLVAITHSLELDANSRHHQAIKRVANELRAVAWSEDGLVEALEQPGKKFAIGVQCHPESLYTKDKKWQAVFRAFVGAASRKQIPARRFTFKRKLSNA